MFVCSFLEGIQNNFKREKGERLRFWESFLIQLSFIARHFSENLHTYMQILVPTMKPYFVSS